MNTKSTARMLAPLLTASAYIASAIAANAQTYTIQQIGLTDPVHTTPSGAANQIGILNAAGQVTGFASRSVGGEDAWFYSPNTHSTQLIGLTDAVHVQAGGAAVNDPEDMNATGQVLGSTARYSGSTFTGYDSWLFSSATNSTQVIGLLDAAHTQADGSYYNLAYHLNASGQVAGYSGRTGDLAGHDAWLYSSATNTTQVIGLTGVGYNGSFGGPNGYSVNDPSLLNAAGQVAGTAAAITGNGPVSRYDAWLYSPTTNTTQRIGLQDPSGGYTVNNPSGMNATGQVVGSAAFYSDGGFTLSRRSAWTFSPTTNATQQIGLVDAAHTQSGGYSNHVPIALNDVGQVAGTSNRFSGSTDQGQDAWLNSSKANSTQMIGLTDGAHIQASGYSFNQANGMNAVGDVIGFAKRYSGSADQGQDAWCYSPSTNTTQLIGLTDKIHTQVGGTSVNNTVFVNAGGLIAGTAKRYNGNSDPSMSSENGIDSWLFDPVSRVTYNLVSSRSATGFASSTVSYLGDDGIVLGTYNVNGGSVQDAFLWTEAAGFHDLGNLVQGGLTAAGWTNLADVFGANGSAYIIGDGTLSNDSGMTFELAPVAQLPGDYNHNGIVDAADYVVWRKGLGTTNTQADYNVWRAHFSQSAGSGVALPSAEPLSSSVPEPASLILAGFLGVVVFVVRWQRQYVRVVFPRYQSSSAVVFVLTLVINASVSHSLRASTVYSNDFESDATGFTNAGVLPALTRTSLPTDGGGLSSANQSTWLGRLGEGVTKSTSNKEIVDLDVSGLTPGTVYTVAFDLLVGASWDGAADGYGTDAWYFSVDGIRLVDTMFSNGDQGVDYGAYSPQRYSDAHYADPNGPDVSAFTGAEFSRKDGPGYTGYYGIYYFSHGAGNPNLKFTATGSTVVLEWARYSGGTNFSDSPDEYWALDNVAVSSVPEPSTFALVGLGFLSLVVRVRRTSTRNYV